MALIKEDGTIVTDANSYANAADAASAPKAVRRLMRFVCVALTEWF